MSAPTTHRAVFLSYAREDTEPARRIADALRGFGVEVWFDQSELRGGDSWDAKIRREIRECALFVPIISAATQARGEGYFRREWRLAVDRTHDMAHGVPFIVPVVVDATLESEALVPDEFMRVQWTRLSDGIPTPEFVVQIKHLLESPRSRTTAARPAAGPVTPAQPAATTRHANRGLVAGGIAIVAAVLVAGYFVLSKRGSSPTAPAAPAVAAAAPSAIAPTEPRPVPTPIADKSIAVLPFANMSEDKDANGFFADGIHEDILTNLALVRELRVVSRTSVMQYRATTKSLRQIAQELGVAYVLEGSVRRAGNKVRVTGQLIRGSNDEHVWAKAYDRDLTDIFSIQAELAQEIAGALSAALSPQEKSLLTRRPTDNLAAYDAYVKAREVRQHMLMTSQTEAVPLLQRAVELDPKFAAAWAELAVVYAFQYFSEVDTTAARLAQAKAAIDQAVRLAPDAPEVIEKLGDYYYYGYRDYPRAIEQYQRLAVLRPNDGVVVGSLGLIHRRQGRWADSLAELRRAAQLEPRNLRYVRSLVSTAQALRLYDEAVQAQQQVLAVSNQDLAEQAVQAYNAFLAHGDAQPMENFFARLPAAKQHEPFVVGLRKFGCQLTGNFAKYVELDREARYVSEFPAPRGAQDAGAAFMFAALGDRAAARTRAAEAIALLKADLEKQPTNATLWENLAGAHALLGERAESLRCAQKAMDLVPASRDALVAPEAAMNYGSCLAWLGDKDQALAQLERMLHTPNGENVHQAKSTARWFPLRGDPRFEALVNDPKNNVPLL